jgi:hypothetical protein
MVLTYLIPLAKYILVNVELMQRRLVERRWEEIAKHMAQAQEDYEAGKVFRGTVEDAIAELRL